LKPIYRFRHRVIGCASAAGRPLPHPCPEDCNADYAFQFLFVDE
jgi:hypothetical protein